MRQSEAGGPLPSPRYISKNLFPDRNLPSDKITQMFVYFGQFIDHDITRTAITEILRNPDEGREEVFIVKIIQHRTLIYLKVRCASAMGETEMVKCGFDGCQDSQPGQEACWPIPVPEDDSDFAYNRCIKFVRSMEVPPLSCRMGELIKSHDHKEVKKTVISPAYSIPGPREQLNQPTHWLDASMIYGDTMESVEELRDHSDRGSP